MPTSSSQLDRLEGLYQRMSVEVGQAHQGVRYAINADLGDTAIEQAKAILKTIVRERDHLRRRLWLHPWRLLRARCYAYRELVMA